MMGSKILRLLVGTVIGASFLSLQTAESLGAEGHDPSSEDDSKPINVDDFLAGVIENFRKDMKTGIPELNIPVLDPFIPSEPFTVDVDDSKASVHGNFTNLKIEGLSEFVMEHLSADLDKLKFHFWLMIPRLAIDGNYSISGNIIKIVPLRGEGGFWIDSRNLSIGGKASMVKTQNRRLQLSEDFDVDMDLDKLELDFENFMGGGRWTEVLKQMLNDMSKDLFHKCLPLLKRELNRGLREVINKQLLRRDISTLLPGSTKANDYIDQILVNVREYIEEHQLDPMSLPDIDRTISKRVMRVNVTGTAKLYNGFLKGISNLHRTDHCRMSSNRTAVDISAHVGLRDLALRYKGEAKFMALGPSFHCGGEIKKVSFFIRIVQSNEKGSKPDLQEFEIKEISTIWVDIDGISPISTFLKWILTGYSKVLHHFIVKKMTDVIRVYIEGQLQQLSFPI